MPELPEVETVMRGLAPALEGRRIVAAEARRPDLRWPLPERFAERLTGRRVEALSRRSKYILAALDDGWSWIMHLGMSGRFAVVAGGALQAPGAFAHAAPAFRSGELGPHDHIVVDTEAARIVYTDARRFGAMDLWPTAELAAHPLLAALGPEPLETAFDAEALGRAFAGRATSVKAALLDQRRVAGLGNIYVCEALWRARIDPRRAAGDLGAAEVVRLHGAVRAVLLAAIQAGGSSLRDYRQADGAMGYFQHSFAAYGREGEACERARCAGRIERLVQGGRSSFYCPRCQR